MAHERIAELNAQSHEALADSLAKSLQGLRGQSAANVQLSKLMVIRESPMTQLFLKGWKNTRFILDKEQFQRKSKPCHFSIIWPHLPGMRFYAIRYF